MEGRAIRRMGMALLVLALVVCDGTVARAAETPRQTVHLLVHFAAGTTDAERAAALREVGGTIEGEIRALGVTRIAISVERGADPAALLRAVAAQPKVSVVEQDTRVHLDWTPNDPYWDTDPYVGLGQWGEKKVSLDRALDLSPSLASVTVAVIDTGVDAGHPDLAGVVLPGTTILSSQSADCDADAFGSDDNSHGTHVSGIIAANANNGRGIAGIASNARILPIKALDCTGSGSLFDIANGIAYAVDHGARVINISLGSSSDSATLETAVRYAVSHDVLIVAAAGNCGQTTSRCFNVQNLVEYPGASPGVLGVGATAMDDSIASFSTQGPQVAITAPGVRIVSTTPHYPTYLSAHGATMNYAAFSGTSQATPFVSGAAALLLGVDATLTSGQVTQRLRSSAVDLGERGVDPAYGAGRLDLRRAIELTTPVFSARYDTSFVPRSVTVAAAFTAKVAVTNSSRATWPSTGTAAIELSYHWRDASGATVVSDGLRTPLPNDVEPGGTVAVDMRVVAPPKAGSYVLSVDLVRQADGYFSARGVAPGEAAIAIGNADGAAYSPLTLYVAIQDGRPVPLVVTLWNTGTTTWRADGMHPVRLSYHWLSHGVMTEWDGLRAPLPRDIAPGEMVVIELPVMPPDGPAIRTLRLDLVEEGVKWFSDDGIASRDVLYVVIPGSS